MRAFRILLAAAAVSAAGSAFAQGAEKAPQQAPDPAQSKAVDEAYRGRCEANAPKPLCSCVIAVGGAQIPDPSERQIFFDFMMGDIDKAKTARALFSPQKNMEFNVALQKADVLLGDQCDKLKPQPKEAPAGQPAPEGGQKLP